LCELVSRLSIVVGHLVQIGRFLASQIAGPSDRQANRQLLPAAGFTQVPNAGHFIALERPEVPASLLNSAV
jgi:pimeloyl-ACP methyl ester carboxylesterase